MLAPTIRLGPAAAAEFTTCGVERDAHESRPPFESIFEAADGLAPGRAVRLALDHDPEPLLEVLEARSPGRFRWEPLLSGPVRWVGLIRRQEPGSMPAARPRSPRLVRRLERTRARGRLEGELRAIAFDLLGPSTLDALPADAAAWVEEAADRAVDAVRDASLGVLVERLEAILADAPPAVADCLEEATARQEAGLV